MSDRTFVDPEKFASEFSRSALENDISVEDYVDKAKEQLLAYLTAFYLVEDFNGAEAQNFKNNEEKNFQDLSFNELLTRVAQLNKY